jgi:hypothetical protein
VQLRFFAVGQAAPSGVTVTLNPNGGSVSPTSITRTPGNTYGSGGSLPTPTRIGDPLFIDWFTTSGTTGGTRIRNNSTVPNSNHTLFARWTNPNRHDIRWWPPVDSGTTRIPLRFNYAAQPQYWRTNIHRAVNNWNASNTRVSFYSSDLWSANQVFVTNSAQSWVGICTPLDWNGPHITRFEVVLNSRMMYWNARDRGNPLGLYNNVYTAITHVMLHELGHSIGLRDDPIGTTDSIMIIGSERLTPSSFDIQSVNMIYN